VDKEIQGEPMGACHLIEDKMRMSNRYILHVLVHHYIQNTKQNKNPPCCQTKQKLGNLGITPLFLTGIMRSLACWKGIEMLYNSSLGTSSRKPW
jgi:hypothetical protein